MEGIYYRGDRVNFLGKKEADTTDDGQGSFRPYKNTFVWAVQAHLHLRYIIEHPDGLEKENYINAYGNFPDGFENIHSRELQDGIKYIYAEPHELELVHRKVPSPADNNS